MTNCERRKFTSFMTNFPVTARKFARAWCCSFDKLMEWVSLKFYAMFRKSRKWSC